MSFTPELIYQIVSVVLIPVIVTLFKKMKMSSKWAPIASFGVALVLVSIAKVFGLNLDVNSISQTILAALATAGVSVLGYDTVKKLTETK